MISAGPNPLPIEANHGSFKEKCKAVATTVHDKCSAGIAQRAEGDNNLYDFHEAYRNGKKVPFGQKLLLVVFGFGHMCLRFCGVC